MSRARWSVVVGVVALAWFGWGSEDLAAALKVGQAHSTTRIQLYDVLLAVERTATEEPSALPRDEAATSARVLLERALEADRIRSVWPQLAAAALPPELLAIAAAGTVRESLPRTRTHPHLPPELLAVEAILAERHGSWAGRPAMATGQDLWSGLPPDDQAKGLLSLVETHELEPSVARQLQSAVMMGLAACDRLPDLEEQLAEALGPGVMSRAQATGQASDPNLVSKTAREAVEILRRREPSPR